MVNLACFQWTKGWLNTGRKGLGGIALHRKATALLGTVFREGGVCSGWGQNDTLRVFPVSFHYVEHSVFADAKVTCNPTI